MAFEAIFHPEFDEIQKELSVLNYNLISSNLRGSTTFYHNFLGSREQRNKFFSFKNSCKN